MGSDNVLVGQNVTCNHNNCRLIGDNLTSTADGQGVVGETLFGKPIPPHVIEVLCSYPDEIDWIFRVITQATQEIDHAL
jgi:hypothetical protein